MSLVICKCTEIAQGNFRVCCFDWYLEMGVSHCLSGKGSLVFCSVTLTFDLQLSLPLHVLASIFLTPLVLPRKCNVTLMHLSHTCS